MPLRAPVVQVGPARSAVGDLVRENGLENIMVGLHERITEVEAAHSGLQVAVDAHMHTASEIREVAREEMRSLLNTMLQILDGEEQLREVSE